MTRCLVLLLAVSWNASGQLCGDLELPEERQVSGVVVDVEGRPIADAWVDHLVKDMPFDLKTDSEGRFSTPSRGTYGESASYCGADEETAHLQDRLLDSVCLVPR